MPKSNVVMLEDEYSGNIPRKRTRKQKTERIIKEKFEEQRKVKPLTAKSDNQRKAFKAFTEKQMVILSGSAGVGKTEMMCWWASKLWLEGRVDNIIITRPHQHLGNDYGAINGNDTLKLLPFCMSMLMKLKKYLGVGILRNNFRTEVGEQLFEEVSGIAIIPVEKIQGMSYDSRTIILADEIQSATPTQVKALVTRMEEGAQIIIAGDKNQSALRGKNGLSMLEEILEKYPHPDSEIIRFTPRDNCRSGISGHLATIFEQQGAWEQ